MDANFASAFAWAALIGSLFGLGMAALVSIFGILGLIASSREARHD